MRPENRRDFIYALVDGINSIILYPLINPSKKVNTLLGNKKRSEAIEAYLTENQLWDYENQSPKSDEKITSTDGKTSTKPLGIYCPLSYFHSTIKRRMRTVYIATPDNIYFMDIQPTCRIWYHLRMSDSIPVLINKIHIVLV